jgi:ATP-dependent RNA helicase DeaD
MSTELQDTDAGVQFAQFGLDPRLLRAVDGLGYSGATPVQAEAIPPLMEGRDVLGQARTGSGKTAAFALPMLQRLRTPGNGVRALVLAPTRELAVQVTKAIESFSEHMPVRVLSVYGGTSYGPQLQALSRGVDVVVGTPGRLLDLMDRGNLDLSRVEMLVLDEADEMLRMGFIDDVERIIAATPPGRQVALFSATMPTPIRRIAETNLNNPVLAQVEETALSSDHIEQRWMAVPQRHKLDALVRLLQGEGCVAVLVFCRTRRDCAEVADELAKRGLNSDALHGDLNQAARERVLQRFRDQRLQIVVATDVAARGLDIDHISHVVNLELPPDVETYVHRIGRTGRAGRLGIAISLINPADRRRVKMLERALQVEIRQVAVPSDADIHRAQRDGLRKELEVALADDVDDARAWLMELCRETGWSEEDVAAAALKLVAQGARVELSAPAHENPPSWTAPPAPPSRYEQRRENRFEQRGDNRSVFPPDPRPDRQQQAAPDNRSDRRQEQWQDVPNQQRAPHRGDGHPAPWQDNRHDNAPSEQRREHAAPQYEAPRGRSSVGPRRQRPDSRAASVDQVELFFPIGSQDGLRPSDVVGALANECGVPGSMIGRVTIVDSKAFVGVPRDVAAQILSRYHRLILRGHDVPLTLARPRTGGPLDGGGRDGGHDSGPRFRGKGRGRSSN